MSVGGLGVNHFVCSVYITPNSHEYFIVNIGFVVELSPKGEKNGCVLPSSPPVAGRTLIHSGKKFSLRSRWHMSFL